MIDKLREINDDILLNTNDEEKRNRHMIIKKIMNDDNCFFKMRIEYAYAILRDLGVEEEKLKDVYMYLIDSEEIKN